MIINYKNARVAIDDNEILHDVTFEVAEGDFVFLIGRVGSGKTSLLRTLYGMVRTDGEKAEVLGVNLCRIKRRKLPMLRRQMGIVFQDFQLMPDRSVYANLEFVLRATGWKSADIQPRIEQVLQTVGLSDKANMFPHELSGGEQQRVSIARAILNNPKLIIADEPTGNLDNETSNDILQLLYQLSIDGVAVIMSTHNLELLQCVKARVFQCDNHQISEISAEQTSPADKQQSTDLFA